MTQSCGGRDTTLNDRNSIHDNWKMLERWSKANKGAKYKFYIWIKKKTRHNGTKIGWKTHG